LAKAVQFSEYGSPAVLNFVDIELPPLKRDEIRFRVIAAPVNRGDIEIRSGSRKIKGKEPFPCIPGLEAVGQITECGAGVHGIKVGDYVITMMQKLGGIHGEIPGSHQEFVTVNVYAVAKLLDNHAPLDAVALGLTSVTALNGITRLGLHKNETVLITGASGGVGSAAVQIAKAMNFKVIATTTSSSKIGYLNSLGADRIINTEEQPISEQIESGKVDGVLDTVGKKTFADCVRTLKKGGKLCSVGASSGANIELLAWELMREVILTGYSSEDLSGDKLRADLGQLLEWHGSGRITTPKYECMPLSEAIRAHELIESNAHTGRILLTPDAR
jgi:NADPH2:quinone reductase